MADVPVAIAHPETILPRLNPRMVLPVGGIWGQIRAGETWLASDGPRFVWSADSMTVIYSQRVIDGDVQGGSLDNSGQITSGGRITSVMIDGFLSGDDGRESGEIKGVDIGPVFIAHDLSSCFADFRR